MARRRVTITDIARQARVSTSAVSYALNDLPGVSEDTRRRIVEIADELGWRPHSAARALQSSRTGAVGLVLLGTQQPTGEMPDFLLRFLPGLQEELAAHGLLLVLHLVPGLEDANATHLQWRNEHRVDGVIVINPIVRDPRLPELERLGLPAVVVGDTRRASSLPAVWTDDAAATELAVDHLAGLGHRRLVRVASRSDYLHARVREREFTRATVRAGLPAGRSLYAADHPSSIERELVEAAEPATAIVYDEPWSAMRGVAALREAGARVPVDVSVMCWDDSYPAQLANPPLTVLRRDLAGYGRLVARRLAAELAGERAGHVKGTHTELVVRGSTGPAR